MTALRTLRDGVRSIAYRTGLSRVTVAALFAVCIVIYWPAWIARDLVAGFRAGWRNRMGRR